MNFHKVPCSEEWGTGTGSCTARSWGYRKRDDEVEAVMITTAIAVETDTERETPASPTFFPSGLLLQFSNVSAYKTLI